MPSRREVWRARKEARRDVATGEPPRSLPGYLLRLRDRHDGERARIWEWRSRGLADLGETAARLEGAAPALSRRTLEARARAERLLRELEATPPVRRLSALPAPLYAGVLVLLTVADMLLIELALRTVPLDDVVIRAISILVPILLVVLSHFVGVAAAHTVRDEGQRPEARRHLRANGTLLALMVTAQLAIITTLALLRAGQIVALERIEASIGVDLTSHETALAIATAFLQVAVVLVGVLLGYRREQGAQWRALRRDERRARAAVEECVDAERACVADLNAVEPRKQELEELAQARVAASAAMHGQLQAEYLSVWQRASLEPAGQIEEWARLSRAELDAPVTAGALVA